MNFVHIKILMTGKNEQNSEKKKNISSNFKYITSL